MFMLRKLSVLIVVLILSGMFFLTGCKDPTNGDTITPIPDDKNPAITLIGPSNNNALALAGSNVVFNFRMDDNEALKLFRVVGQQFDQRDSLIGTEFIAFQDTISGKVAYRSLNYLVPSLPVAYKVRLTAYAIDTKGAYNKSIVWVSVVDVLPPPPPYGISNPYPAKKVYSKMAGTNQYYFQFTLAGANPPPAFTSADFAETSTVPGVFNRQINCPNNPNPDVIVVTDANSFNYDEATWTTAYQAFFSNPDPKNVSAPLNPGDIVIVRLFYVPNYERFGIMRVLNVVDDIGDANDYIEFEYKYTY